MRTELSLVTFEKRHLKCPLTSLPGHQWQMCIMICGWLAELALWSRRIPWIHLITSPCTYPAWLWIVSQHALRCWLTHIKLIFLLSLPFLNVADLKCYPQLFFFLLKPIRNLPSLSLTPFFVVLSFSFSGHAISAVWDRHGWVDDDGIMCGITVKTSRLWE